MKKKIAYKYQLKSKPIIQIYWIEFFCTLPLNNQMECSACTNEYGQKQPDSFPKSVFEDNQGRNLDGSIIKGRPLEKLTMKVNEE